MSSSAIIKLDIWSILLVGSAFLGYFFSAILITHKKGNRGAGISLGLLILVVALTLTEYLLIRSGYYFDDNFHQIIFATTPLSFLKGPLYYFYAQFALQREARLKLRHLAHCIPAVLVLVNFLPAYLKLAGSKPIFGANYFVIWISGYLYMGLQILHTSLYVHGAAKLFRALVHDIKNRFSNSALIYWMGMKKLTHALAGILAIQFLGLLLMLTMKAHVVEIEYMLALALAFLIQAVGYVTIRESGLLAEITFQEPAGKYQHSTLTQEQARACLAKLLRYMETEKPYLRDNLKLPELAKNISISTNHLSQLLNQELGRSFFDFINWYRVQEAQMRLADSQCKHLTHLAIAYETGFSNKTSFNRVFKKHTGMTPSQFVKKNRQEGSPQSPEAAAYAKQN